MDQKSLTKIKVILSLEKTDKTKDTLLKVLLDNAVKTIAIYLGINIDDFPESLSFIAEELTVARYSDATYVPVEAATFLKVTVIWFTPSTTGKQYQPPALTGSVITTVEPLWAIASNS